MKDLQVWNFLSSLCKLSRYKRSSRACKSITLLIFLSAVESILRSFIGRRRATRQGLLIFLKEFLFKHCDPFLGPCVSYLYRK